MAGYSTLWRFTEPSSEELIFIAHRIAAQPPRRYITHNRTKKESPNLRVCFAQDVINTVGSTGIPAACPNIEKPLKFKQRPKGLNG